MNEGWASFWHNRIMRELSLTDDEFIEFGRLHCGVCTPGRSSINPYYVGLKMFEDIEKRFGREKIFEVREMENDVSFIRNWLTEELCEELDLFVYQLEEDRWTITDKQWEKVRNTLCESMTNFGQPYITVEDGDYGGRRELLLRHHHDGRHLDQAYADRTLRYVVQLWGRPAHIHTEQDGKSLLLSCDGEKTTQTWE
jgi:stage V sporulation protein R